MKNSCSVKDIKVLLGPIFNRYPKVKLVYFFGSRVKNNDGPMSDYDFAFYINERSKKELFSIKFRLMDEISRALKTDKIDIVILNLSKSPELMYEVIKYGKIIFEKDPYRIIIEPQILNRYFDYKTSMRIYNLTKS